MSTASPDHQPCQGGLTTPAEQEGVIKFHLDYSPAPSLPIDELKEVNAWRQILYRLSLIGQDPQRYGGLGFGNISRRLGPLAAPPHKRRFAVSGTQTGGLEALSAVHYATVLECHSEQNRVVAEGPIRPSSEALTHGVLYSLDGTLRFVMHVHSPEIWRHAAALGIPSTRDDAAYGTPEMGREVMRLFRQTDVASGHIFAMGGHEDGVVSFGQSAEQAGEVLVRNLARAYQRER